MAASTRLAGARRRWCIDAELVGAAPSRVLFPPSGMSHLLVVILVFARGGKTSLLLVTAIPGSELGSAAYRVHQQRGLKRSETRQQAADIGLCRDIGRARSVSDEQGET